MTFLCAAVMVGVIVDHARGTVTRWFVSVGRRELIRRSNARWQQCAAAVVALAIALVAVVPIATSYAGNIPLTMQPIVLPLWFSQVAPDLPGGQVVLTYPAAFSDVQSSITWQAVDRMHFAMPGGGGPQAVPSRAGAERAGLTVLADAAFSIGPLQPPGAAAIAAVRRALSGWGVTLVVVPDQPELPQYDQGSHTAYTVGLFTEALGRLPRYQARAWVWSGVPGPGQALAHITPAAFQACVGTANYRPGAPQTVPDCVLAASG